jgi:hypothetical protein
VWLLTWAHKLISYAKDCCSVDDPTQLAKWYSRVITPSGSKLTLKVAPMAVLEEQCFAALRTDKMLCEKRYF